MYAFTALVGWMSTARAQDELSLDALLDLEVTSASATAESILDAPAPMIVLTRDDITRRGYQSMVELMKDLPGFDVVDAGGNTEMLAHQRGFRSTYMSRTLVMIDGRPFRDLWYQDAGLAHQFPMDAIDRVEILYGPAGAIYGPNAFLGVVNIITTDASDLDVTAYNVRSRAMLGSWNTRNADLSVRGRPTDQIWFSLSGRYHHTDGADISNRDNAWMHEDFVGSRTIWGPLVGREHLGTPFGTYSNQDDDYMLIGRLGLGELEIGAVHSRRSASNGGEYTGDRAQPANVWPSLFTEVSLSHERTLADGKLVLSSSMWGQQTRRLGLWADASPSSIEGETHYSNLTMIDFSTINQGLFLRQRAIWNATDAFRLSAGYSIGRKQLTKAFDTGDGYWGAYNSNGAEDASNIYYTAPRHQDDGSIWYDNLESGLPEPFDVGATTGRMPFDNQVWTTDIGAFVEGNLDIGPLQFNAGIRYDENANPGVAEHNGHRGYRAFSPRGGLVLGLPATGILHGGALKLLYGRAIQEPSATDLWGGWSGRNAAPGLRPETAQNAELVAMAQTGPVFTDISAYWANYQRVQVAPPANAGSRTIMGLEYRGRLQVPNPIPASQPLRAWLHYTLTHGVSSHVFDHASGEWQQGDGKDVIGDIAPHKLQFGLDVPATEHFAVNLKGRYVAARTPFLSNALRDSRRPDGGQTDWLHPYFVGDVTLQAQHSGVSLGLGIRNITNADYNHPGLQAADGGDGWVRNDDGSYDTRVRSTGYRSSFIPQNPRSLNVWLRTDL